MSSWNWASNPLTGGEPPRRSSSHLLVWRALTIQFLLGTVEIAFGLRANTRMPPATEAPQVQEILYAHCATAWGNHVEEVLSEHHHVKINHRRRGSIGHFRSKRTKVAVVVFFFHCMLHIQFYRHLQNQVYCIDSTLSIIVLNSIQHKRPFPASPVRAFSTVLSSNMAEIQSTLKSHDLNHHVDTYGSGLSP